MTSTAWKLVPVEPTEEMLRRGWSHRSPTLALDGLRNSWRAMLAAAPSPPSGEIVDRSAGASTFPRHPDYWTFKTEAADRIASQAREIAQERELRKAAEGALRTARAMLVEDGWLPKGLAEIDKVLDAQGKNDG